MFCPCLFFRVCFEVKCDGTKPGCCDSHSRAWTQPATLTCSGKLWPQPCKGVAVTPTGWLIETPFFMMIQSIHTLSDPIINSPWINHNHDGCYPSIHQFKHVKSPALHSAPTQGAALSAGCAAGSAKGGRALCMAPRPLLGFRDHGGGISSDGSWKFMDIHEWRFIIHSHCLVNGSSLWIIFINILFNFTAIEW